MRFLSALLTLLSATTALAASGTGKATFYYQGGAFGSCGEQHSDGDYLVAMSHVWNNQFCGRGIIIKNVGGGGSANPGVGRQISARVVDKCMGCDANYIDLSVGAFRALTGGNLDPPGTFQVEWRTT
ncbi:hypothetical protein M501DRAFT_989482 [Patellaria atrata CBS 101060]|uniref:Uncharacterized protein n=1 Tax=Patellaria atrata CBS 101060 TaxID=1346257 RepID=A0A9P4VMJ0_9PEZI|nr:hypothetical protein M501DRAFT_989482 [Patellaria atrata CBS 101060]